MPIISVRDVSRSSRGACQACRGTLGAKVVVICKPGDPEAKGLVERFHDYLERAFLPGRGVGLSHPRLEGSHAA
jgi:hypothetical protein